MIYFDNSATTKPYDDVLKSFIKVSTDYFGNPSSLHGLGGQAESLLNQSRAQISSLLNVNSNEIVFTSGGTEGNNLAIKGTALMHKHRGNHIITSKIEHASVHNAFKHLEEQGFEVSYIPTDRNGVVDVNDIKNNIRKDTILVSIMHVNNEVGTIQPIQEIGNVLVEYPKIYFHVDGVQGIGKVPLSIKDSNIDLYTISAHKFHGLKGTGVLFIKEGRTIFPLLSGGEQESRWRSGTENVAGAVSMAKALRLTLQKQEEKLDDLILHKNIIRKELENIKGVKVHSPNKNSAPHILNFSIKGFKAEVFVHALEEKNIYVSTTSACSSKRKSVSHTLLAMGVPEEEAESAIRISLSYENTMDEVRTAIKGIKETVTRLRKVMS